MTEYKSPKFEPINSAHAIVETVFFCEFQPELSSSVMNRLLLLEDDPFLTQQLPKFNEIKRSRFGISIDPETNMPAESGVLQTETTGFERQSVKRDGNREWMLRVTQEAITVHCLEYTRWDDIWPKARKLLHTVFDKIGTSNSALVSIGLKYIDQFIFQGETEDQYDASLLFNESSKFLHKKSFSSGSRWHCHTGWFGEKAPDIVGRFECLNQLNIDSAFSHVSGRRKLITTIDHSLIIRGEGEDLPSFTGELQDQDSSLNRLMEFLHQSNKEALSDLLSSEMKDRISLWKEGTS